MAIVDYAGPDESVLPDQVASTVIAGAVPDTLSNGTLTRHTHPLVHAKTNAELIRLAQKFVAHINDSTEHGAGAGGVDTLDELTDVDVLTATTAMSIRKDVGGTWKGRLDRDLNILSFGAVVGATADSGVLTANTAALNAAVVAAIAMGGARIMCPGMVYKNGDVICDGGTDGDGVYFAGFSKDCGVYDTRTNTHTVLTFIGSEGNRIRNVGFEHFRIDGAGASGSTQRTAINLTDVGHLFADNLDVWNCKRAIFGENWWDSAMLFCRFDQCGNSSEQTDAIIYLDALGGGSNRDNNSQRWIGCTWEQSWARDMYLKGTGKRNNKFLFLGNKWETTSAFQQSERVVIDTAHHVVVMANHFSIGTPVAAGMARNILDIINTNHAYVIGNDFEGQPIAVGLNPVRTFIRLSGTCAHPILRDNNFECSSNNNPTVGCIEYVSGATITDAVDEGNGFSYIAGGSPVLRVGRPTSFLSPFRSKKVRLVNTAGSHQLDWTDQVVLADATNGNVTILMPAAGTHNDNITVKRIDNTANTVTIDDSVLAIETANTWSLKRLHDAVEFCFYSLSWYAVASHSLPSVTSIKTANYTVLVDDAVMFVDPTTASFTITLPAPTIGRELVFIRTTGGANTVTLTTPGSEKIDGADTLVLVMQREAVRLLSDGSNWYLAA